MCNEERRRTDEKRPNECSHKDKQLDYIRHWKNETETVNGETHDHGLDGVECEGCEGCRCYKSVLRD